MITHITITNFRGLKHADIDLADADGVLISGYNGSGKTSAADAIRFALTGETRNQEGKKHRVGELVGPHGKHATIDITDNAGWVLHVKITTSTTMYAEDPDGNTVTGAPDQVRAAWCAARGIDQRKLHACCHPRAYLVGNTLAGLISQLQGGLDPKRLQAECGDHLDWLRAFAKTQSLKIRSLDDLQKLGVAAYSERTDANRRYKKLRDDSAAAGDLRMPASLIGKNGERFDTLDVIDIIENALSEMRGDRDGLQRELGATSNRRDPQDLRQQIDLHKRALDALRQPQHIEPLEREAGDLRGEYETVSARLREAEAALREAEATQADTNNSSACPTCNRPFKPHERPDARALQEAVDSARAEVDAIKRQSGDLRSRLDRKENELRQVRAAWQTYHREHARMEAELNALRGEVEMEPARDRSAIEEDLREVDARIQTEEAALAAVRAWDAHEKRQNELAAVRAEIEHLNWAVAAFRDGEVTQALGGDACSEFAEAINAHLEPHGYTLSFAGEKNEMLAYLKKGDKRPVVTTDVSDGELALAQMAVIAAFNAGIGIVDSLDDLDGLRKGDAICSVSGGMIAAGAWTLPWSPFANAVDEDGKPLPITNIEMLRRAIAPTALVWVEDGEATRVIAQGVAA